MSLLAEIRPVNSFCSIDTVHNFTGYIVLTRGMFKNRLTTWQLCGLSFITKEGSWNFVFITYYSSSAPGSTTLRPMYLHS